MEIKLLLLNIFPSQVTSEALFTQILALVSTAFKGTEVLHFPDADA